MIINFTQWLGLGPRSLFILIFITVCALQLNAQKNKEYILKNTNVEALNKLAERLQKENEQLFQTAKEKGWPTSNLIGIDFNGNPMYVKPTNATASERTKTTELREDFGVNGSGMNIGMWEANDNIIEDEDTTILWSPRTSHEQLLGRITQIDVETNSGGFFASHATHVAGTLIGSGNGDSDARGMAPSATLSSYSSANDFTEMATAAGNGMLISNHSYGTISGWERDGSACTGLASKWTWYGGPNQFNVNGEDPNFGAYSSSANRIDSICWNAPMYLPVKSSGNDHNDVPSENILCDDDVRNGSNGTYVTYNADVHPGSDGSNDSSITTWGNAKNNLTVGNVRYTENSGSNSEVINASSSRGKTDDGRIKPDICGIGTAVYSADSEANDDYSEKTGTSMSAPNVAGSLLLLQELYEEENGNSMRSATLKGLAIHTAKDLGNDGPDYTYGWGLLDANKAGDVISIAASGANGHRIFEIPSITTAGYSYSFIKNGQIKVTLCYTDVPNSIQIISNDPAPRLINDLDVKLIGPNGDTYFPFVLNPNNPDDIATTGDNDRDNVEQILLDIPFDPVTEGPYTVEVSVEGSITESQPFSLIISGMSDGCGGDDLVLGDNTVDPGYYNEQTITCEGTVESGSNVIFAAGSGVRLLVNDGTGFHALPGSNFRAIALPCD